VIAPTISPNLKIPHPIKTITMKPQTPATSWHVIGSDDEIFVVITYSPNICWKLVDRFTAYHH
jgi:hypothetical protein